MASQKDVQNEHRQQSALTEPPTISGKLVIITIATLAILAAGFSWWFRYSSTNRAARFWGSRAAMLIRDAPSVTFTKLDVSSPSESKVLVHRDVSKAHGMTHLRNALLEDKSFDWLAPQPPGGQYSYTLEFREQPDAPTPAFVVFFSPDLRSIAGGLTSESLSPLSSEPIAAGLSEMFDEFARQPPDEG